MLRVSLFSSFFFINTRMLVSFIKKINKFKQKSAKFTQAPKASQSLPLHGFDITFGNVLIT